MSSGEGLWEFSLRVYAIDGVSGACLALQERHRVDVNLLLYCCWLGHTGRALDAAGLAHALVLSMPWAQHVVRPLRGARSWMKNHGDPLTQVSTADYTALREDIKTVELRAEQLQQQVLESIAGPGSPQALSAERRLRCMASNLHRYLAHVQVEIDAPAEAALSTILAAASGARPTTVQLCLTPATLQKRM